MSSIDERVVQMKFNNGDFEKGVTKTLSSLDKLKAALAQKVSSKSFSDLQTEADKINFAPIEKQIDSVNSKFSLIGATASTVWSNMVTGGMNAIKNVVSMFTAPLIQGGINRALNLEQANFMFEGLGLDAKQMLSIADSAVTGTAYSLDAAAKAAGSLAASNVPLEKMEGTLKAIAGTAAMSGSSFTDVADVFTKVAGQGRLMGDDLLRLSSRGLNAAAELAKYLNTTEADVRDMTTKGKIDFETFSAAMESAFGDSAFKANETFNGALSNLKTSFARIGADIAIPTMQKLRDLFNALRPAVNEFRKALQPLIGSGSNGGILGALNQRFAQFIDGIINKLGPGLDLGYFYDLFQRIANSLNVTEGTASNLSRTLKGLGAAFKIVWEVVKLGISIIGGILSIIGKGLSLLLVVTAWIGDFIVKIKDAGEAVGGYTGIIEKLTKPIKDFWNILTGKEDAFDGVEYTKFIEVADNIHKGFGNARTSVVDFLNSIKDVPKNVFGAISQAFPKVSSNVETQAGKTIAVLKEMWSYLTTGGPIGTTPRVAGGALNTVYTTLTKIHAAGLSLKSIFAEAGHLITKGTFSSLYSMDYKPQWAMTMYDWILKVRSAIVDAGNAVKDFFGKLKPSSLEEAKSKIQEIIDVFRKSDDYEFGDSVSDPLISTAQSAKTAVDTIMEAFDKGFGSKVNKLKAKWNEFIKPVADGLKVISDNVKLAFTSAKDSGLNSLEAGIVAVGNAIASMIKVLSEFSLSDFLGNIGDGFKKVGEVAKESFSILKTGMHTFGEGPAAGNSFTQAIYSAMFKIRAEAINMGNAVKDVFTQIYEWGKSKFSGLGDFATKTWDTMKKGGDYLGQSFTDSFNKIKEMMPGLVSAIQTNLGPAITWIKDKISSITPEQWNDIFTQLFQFGFLKVINDLTKVFGKLSIKGVIGQASEALDAVKSSLTSFQTEVKAKLILNIAIAIGILAAAIFLLGSMDGKRLAAGLLALGGIGAVLSGLSKTFESFSTTVNSVKIPKMIGLSIALGLLAGALLLISLSILLLSKANGTGLAGFSVMIFMLVAMAETLSKEEPKFARAGAGLIVFSIALLALVGIVKLLGSMSIRTILQGEIALAALLGMLILFTKFGKLDKVSAKELAGFNLIAEAVNSLAKTVQVLGKMDLVELAKGVTAVGILLAFCALFTKFADLDKNGSFLKNGAGLLLMAAGIMVIAVAVRMLGSLDMATIGKGILAIFAVMAMMVGAVNLLPNDTAAKVAGIMAFAGAIAIIAIAMRILGGMDWDQMKIALAGLAGALLVVTVAMNAMPQNPVQVGGIIALAGAMLIIAVAMRVLGGLDWKSVGVGLVTLAASLAILLAAGAVAGIPLVAAGLMTLSVAILAIGAGMALAGLGMVLFGAGMVAIGAAAVPFAAGLVVLAKALEISLPMIARGLANSLVEIITVLGERAPEIKTAFIQLLQMVCDALLEGIPMIVETIMQLMIALGEAILEYGPQLQEIAYQILIMFLTGIRDHIEEITTLAMEIMTNFLNGIANNIESLVDAGSDVIVNFMNGIANNIERIVQAGVDIIVNFLHGIRDAIPQIGDAAFEVLQAFCDYVVDNFGKLTTLANDTISKLGSELSSAISSGIGNLFSVGTSIIGKVAEGLISGLDSAMETVKTKAAALGAKVKEGLDSAKGLDINSPSKKAIESGLSVGEGLEVGMSKAMPGVMDSGTNLGLGVMTAMTAALSAANAMIEENPDIDPTITPVLDLSEIESGAGRISGMFTNPEPLNVGANAKTAQSISTRYADEQGSTATDPLVGTQAGVTMQFNQNNYSPKALSREEIYRQTSNQLSHVRKALENA